MRAAKDALSIDSFTKAYGVSCLQVQEKCKILFTKKAREKITTNELSEETIVLVAKAGKIGEY